MRQTIFIVSAYTQYESNHPIAAFVMERDAKAFSQACRDHDAKKPQCPRLEDPEEKWQLFYKRDKNWIKRAPGKGSYGHDDYPVTPMKLRPPVMAKKPD